MLCGRHAHGAAGCSQRRGCSSGPRVLWSRDGRACLVQCVARAMRVKWTPARACPGRPLRSVDVRVTLVSWCPPRRGGSNLVRQRGKVHSGEDFGGCLILPLYSINKETKAGRRGATCLPPDTDRSQLLCRPLEVSGICPGFTDPGAHLLPCTPGCMPASTSSRLPSVLRGEFPQNADILPFPPVLWQSFLLPASPESSSYRAFLQLQAPRHQS